MEHLGTHPLLAIAALGAAGFAAGVLNVLAGGGSLLTLPLLLWLGFPAATANATNRINLVTQNVTAAAAFRRGGVLPLRTVARLLVPAIPGALLGTWVAIDIDEVVFRRVLVGVLLLALWSLLRENGRPAPAGERHPRLLYASFFFMGIYAGFVQAGLGFLLIAALTGLGGFDLVRTNAIKVTLVLIVQVLSLAIFAAAGKVDWIAGGILGVGSALGAYVAARWQMAQEATWVKRVVIALLIAFTVRLVYEGFLA